MKSQNLTDIRLGKLLRQQRILCGMNQQQIGKAIGVTFQQIQKYEKGTNRISSSCLYELSKILCVPITYFFQEEDDSHSAKEAEKDAGDSAADVNLSSREVLEMVRVYCSLSPKIRKSLYGHMKALQETKD